MTLTPNGCRVRKYTTNIIISYTTTSFPSPKPTKTFCFKHSHPKIQIIFPKFQKKNRWAPPPRVQLGTLASEKDSEVWGTGVLNGVSSAPWKIRMEHTHHPFRKENDRNQISMIMFHVNLPGCNVSSTENKLSR